MGDGLRADYSLAYTTPPVYQMPQVAERVLTELFVVSSLALLLYAIWVSYRRRSALPVLFWAAAAITALLEPIADIMGQAVHSQLGEMNIYTVKGHPIPLYAILAYPAYFGLIPIIAFDAYREQTMKRRQWIIIALVTFVGVTMIEQIPVRIGLWHYYGSHPFQIGVMPVDMISMNIVAVMASSLISYKLMPYFTGVRQIMLLGIFPAAAVGGHAACGMFAYNVLGLNQTVSGPILVQATGVVTIVMALILIWAMLQIVYGDSPRPRSA